MRIDKIVKTRSDGSLRVRWSADAGIDPATGKKRRKMCETYAEAKAWLQAPTKPETAKKPTSRTLSWIGEQFVKDREAAGRERSTWEKYDQHFKQHINKIKYEHTKNDPTDDEHLDGLTFGEFEVASMCPRHFIKLKTALVSTRSHAMAMRVWSTLAVSIDHGIALEALKGNIARSIKIDRKARETNEPVEIPTKDEIKILRDATMPIGGEPLSVGQAMIALTMTTGLRPSEMRALPWACVNIDQPPYFLSVTKRVDQWRKSGPPKSAAGYREIPLPESTVRLLREWKLQCPKVGILDLVFPTSAGTHWNHSNIYNRIWEPYQIALGICEPRLDDKGNPVLNENHNPVMVGRYTWYSLRHSYASIQIDMGMVPKVLQRRMGHANIQTTLDRYGHLWVDRNADALDMLAFDQWFDDL